MTVVEGVRCAREALSAGASVRLAVVAPRLATLAGGSELETRVRMMAPVGDTTDRELGSLSDAESHQGVLLVCACERRPLSELDTAGRYVVLDGVQDPGNVGTLIRSAHAFGLDGLIALKGTADLWSPKVLRASAGSAFHLALAVSTATELVDWARRGGLGLKVAEASRARAPIPSVGCGWALVIGNEGSGVGEAIREAADLTVGVPMAGGAESLNAAVAGSILMYLFTRGGMERGDTT